MKAIRITNWDTLYEVNEKNRAWKPGEKKRLGALEYLRCRVHGSNWSAGYREFLTKAGRHAAAGFGVFVKALELAGDQTEERRGWLLDRAGQPLDAASFAHATGFLIADATRAFDILTDKAVGLLEWANLPKDFATFREFPECSGISPSEKSISEKRRRETTPPIPFDQIVADWNKMAQAAGLPEVSRLTDGRREKMKARWADGNFRAKYPDVLAKISSTAFLRGQNDRAWKADFDWLFKNGDSYVKVLEGKYDGNGRARQAGGGPAVREQDDPQAVANGIFLQQLKLPGRAKP